MQPKYLIAIGLAIIALAMWYSTSLAPDASFSYFATLRIFQTVGLPFLFIPINMVAYAGLPQQKTAQASALMNVARNLGGSIGVSLANTELVQRSQFHQARLTEHVVPTSLPIRKLCEACPTFSRPRAVRALMRRAKRWACSAACSNGPTSLLAYIDVFRDYALFAAVMIAIAFVLRSVDSSQAARAH